MTFENNYYPRAIPLPVTVIGVTVVEARGAKTGVPAVATEERVAAKRP